uniref:Uncharacterized protein n=1 Tax=Tanacetum cinerariifolium TaxID=118510 RepID=A0A699H774_TANCI|nr:hypothetical protein [Tanacetum cinerariifolium]
MVKNLDNVNKILMYPRFVQVFLDMELEGMSTHNRIYVTLSHTKKIFGNMRRVGKGFSRRETPLFPTMMVQAQEEIGEGSANPTDPHHTPTIIQPSTSQPQKKPKPRKTKRKDTELPQTSGPTTNIVEEAVNEEINDSLKRVATTASSLEAEQDNGNINKTQSKATLNEPSSIGTSSGSGPKCQETMRDTIAQTRSENVSKFSNNSLLVGVNTPRSDEDGLKLKELMELCTTLQNKVLDLGNTKTTQALEIDSLKKRVKKLEKKQRSRTHKLKRLYKVGLTARVDSSDEASLEVPLKEVNDAAATTITAIINDITLAKALMVIKSAKPKADKEQAPTPTVSSQQPLQVKVQDNGKGKKVEPEPVKKLSKKDQLMLDEELAFKLQAEKDEEERLAKEKAQEIKEVNIAWDDIQAKIDADYQLAQRLTELVLESLKEAEAEVT